MISTGESAIKTIVKAIIFISLAFIIIGQPQEEPAQEKITLRIGTTDQVRSANLLLDQFLSLFAHISNPTLMKMSSEIRPVGQLAQQITPSSDLLTWTIKIHDNFYWSDGRPVTSDDIKFSLEYMQDEYPAAGWIKQSMDQVIIIDAHTLSVKLKQPYSRLDFEFVTYPMLPKHIWSQVENLLRYTNTGHNVGCGPFVIDRIDLNRGVITFVPNPHWQGAPPHIDIIEIHIYKNRDVLALALEKGDVDIFYEYASPYPYSNLGKIRASADFTLMERLNLGPYFLGWNLKRKPMSDLKFREAMAYAIDYNELTKLVILGYGGVPRRGFVPPNMLHFKETPALEYDPEKAKALLDEAGYRDSNRNGIRENGQGKDMRFTLLVESSKQFQTRMAELVKDYFEAVGIRVNLKAVEGNSWVNLKDNYRYDICVTRTSPWGMLMHASWATGYFDSRRTGEGVLHTVDDPVFLKLCDDLLATTDDNRIRDLAHQVQDYYANNLPAIALFWNILITPYNNSYSSWSLDPLYGVYNIDNFLAVKRRQN